MLEGISYDGRFQVVLSLLVGVVNHDIFVVYGGPKDMIVWDNELRIRLFTQPLATCTENYRSRISVSTEIRPREVALTMFGHETTAAQTTA